MERRDRGEHNPKPICDGVPRHRAGRRTSVESKTVTVATPQTADSTLDANHDDGLVTKYRRMEDLLEGGEPPGLAARELEDRSSNNKELLGLAARELKNWSSNNKVDTYNRGASILRRLLWSIARSKA